VAYEYLVHLFKPMNFFTIQNKPERFYSRLADFSFRWSTISVGRTLDDPATYTQGTTLVSYLFPKENAGRSLLAGIA